LGTCRHDSGRHADVEIESLVFHQNNAPAHRAQETIMTMDVLDWFSQMCVKWDMRHENCVTAKGEYFEKN